MTNRTGESEWVQDGSLNVKQTRGPHFIIPDFDDILTVASTTFQTMFCKVSASENQWSVTSITNVEVTFVAADFFTANNNNIP